MVWGNIGDDISLFLCDEGTAELTICDFKSLIPLLLVLCGAFCALLFAGRSLVCTAFERDTLSYVSSYVLWGYLDFSYLVCRSCFS